MGLQAFPRDPRSRPEAVPGRPPFGVHAPAFPAFKAVRPHRLRVSGHPDVIRTKFIQIRTSCKHTGARNCLSFRSDAAGPREDGRSCAIHPGTHLTSRDAPRYEQAQRPAPSAQRPAPSAQRPAPQRPAPSAQRPSRTREAEPVGGARIGRRERRSRGPGSGSRRPPGPASLRLPAAALLGVVAAALLAAAPAGAQSIAWSASLTVDQHAVDGSILGCDDDEGPLRRLLGRPLGPGTSRTAAPRTRSSPSTGAPRPTPWTSASSGNPHARRPSDLLGSEAKTVFGTGRLTVGGAELAFGDAEVAHRRGGRLRWPFDPATDWTDGARVSLQLRLPAAAGAAADVAARARLVRLVRHADGGRDRPRPRLLELFVPSWTTARIRASSRTTTSPTGAPCTRWPSCFGTPRTIA